MLLKGRQRFELAMLCDSFEQTGCMGVPEMAAIVRYVEAERIELEQFNKHDQTALIFGCAALRLLAHRDCFVVESFSYQVLREAGFITPDIQAFPF